MPNTARSRPKLALCSLLLVGCGLASRRPGLAHFVSAYVGDVLWGALFFLLFTGVWPRGRVAWAWLAATLTTELIEFSQRYRAPWLDAARSTRVGGLLLGHVFLWSDVVSVALGTTFALALADLAGRCTRSAEHCKRFHSRKSQKILK